MGIPLLTEGKVLGGLYVANRRIYEFKEKEATLLHNLGTYVVTALEKTRIINRILKEKSKTESIIQSMGEGLSVVDLNKKIVLFNPEASKVTGFKNQEALGRIYTEILKITDKKGTSLLDSSKMPSEIFGLEKENLASGDKLESSNIKDVFITNKEGKSIPIAGKVTALKNETGELIGEIIIFRDTTREFEIEKLKNEFISISSHQLRTPLTAIRWNLEMLLSGDVGELTTPQKELTKQLYKSTLRMIKLVADLLDVSRIEEGRMQIEKVPTHLEDIVESVIGELTPKASEKNIKIIFEKSEIPTLEIDTAKIREVITNLIDNAIKYTNQGGNVTIKIEENQNQELVFSVSDTGVGIPTSEQDRLFSKFFRASNIQTLDVSGTGLGLFIVKSIIEAHSGKVWVESRQGEGSTFYFSLPQETQKTPSVYPDLQKEVLEKITQLKQ